MKKRYMVWSIGISVMVAVFLFALWIQKTYGVLLLAVVDDSFLHFFRNKRSLLVREVICPTIVVFLFLSAIGVFLFKRKIYLNGRRMFSSWVMMVLATIFCLVVILDGNGYIKMYNRHKQEQWYEVDRVVAHACGEIDGLTYTNSREALENSYQKGRRNFECDLILTADGELVACHDWDVWNAWKEDDEATIPTLEEFMNTKIRKTFEPLSGKDVIAFMKEHPDVFVITDTKDVEPETVEKQFQEFVNLAMDNECEEVLNRLVVQIYHPYMYDIINKIYCFDNYIFTLYQEAYRGEPERMQEYARYCREQGIDVITMNIDYYSEELLDICQQYEIELFVHTVNDMKTIAECLDNGIGIYSDKVDI